MAATPIDPVAGPVPITTPAAVVPAHNGSPTGTHPDPAFDDAASALPLGFTDVQPLALTTSGPMLRAAAPTADGRSDLVAVLVGAAPIRDRAARRRLRADCLAAAAVNGEPGVLAVRDLGFTGDHRPFLVTDLPPRGTLAQRLEATGPLPLPEAATLGLTLAAALTAAHAHGILHLGLGPDAVFLADDARPLLGHFALAWALRPPSQPDVPATAVVHAPRELFGWDQPTVASDVYALGSTLWTALSGRAPFEAEARAGRAALYHRLLSDAPLTLPRLGTPPEFAALLERMLASEPARRPTLEEVTATLGAFAAPTQQAGANQWAAMAPMPAAPVPAPAPVFQPPSTATWPPVASNMAAPITPAPVPTFQPPPVAAPPQPNSTAATPAAPFMPPAANTANAPTQPVPVPAFQPPPQPSSTAAAPLIPPAANTASAPTAPSPAPAFQPPIAQPSPLTPPAATPTAPAAPIPAPTYQPPIAQPSPLTPPAATPTAPAAPIPPPPYQPPPTQRRYPTELILLVAAGAIALTAGIVWGVATSPADHPTTEPSPTAAVTAATLLPPDQRAAFQPTDVVVTSAGHGSATVSWTPPPNMAGVAGFIVQSTHYGKASGSQPAGVDQHSALISGLEPGTRYEFVVAAMVQKPGDQGVYLVASTAASFDAS